MAVSADEVRDSLADLGVHLQPRWIAHCIADESSSNGSNGNRQVSTVRAKERVYETFLSCDLREAGAACIPPGVGDIVKQRLQGKFAVQIEESRDIVKTFEQREKIDPTSSHHTLKLALGDGTQTVAAFEYRRIQGLSADPPPGLKLLVVAPWVRRGILLLSADNTTVLGGEISSLVEAREAARAAAGQKKTPHDSTQEGNNNNNNNNNNRNGDNAPTAAPGPPAAQNSSPRRDGRPERGDRTTPGAWSDRIEGQVPEDRRSPRGGRGRPDSPPLSSSMEREQTRRNGSTNINNNSSRNNGGGSIRPSGGGDSSRTSAQPAAARAPASGVANPYAAAARPVAPSSAVATPVLGSRRADGDGAGRGGEQLLRRDGTGEARAQAFPHDVGDGDDGPDFEYLEEPDFPDEQPEEEAEMAEQAQRTNARGGPSGSSDGGVGSSSTSSFPPDTGLAAPPVTSRPTIVTAREQSKRLREEGLRGGEAVADEKSGGCSGEGGGAFAGQGEGVSRKRGRVDGQENSPQDRSHLLSPARDRYTTLAELETIPFAGGLYRVKAKVVDITCCKIRKRKYLLGIQVEDETQTLLLRLSDAMCGELFGMDAKAFKKLAQTSPDQVQDIQGRVEQEILEMEGFMEIDFASAAAGASQSPSAPETPGGVISHSQGSTSSDFEWSLPAVISVTKPGVDDGQDSIAPA